MIPENELKTVYFYWEVCFIFLQTNRLQIMTWDGKRKYTVRRYEDLPQMQQTLGEQLRGAV